MMTRAGRAFARRVALHVPQDSPEPLTYSKMLGGANRQLSCETVSSGTGSHRGGRRTRRRESRPAPPAVREPGQFCRLGESPLDGLMSEIRLD